MLYKYNKFPYDIDKGKNELIHKILVQGKTNFLYQYTNINMKPGVLYLTAILLKD